MLLAPNAVDYLTDDESDDGKGFELKVPNLDELINQFEAPDETINKANESFKQHLVDLKQRGFEKEVREEIKQTKIDKKILLDANISAHRSFYEAALPSMVEDLNTVVKDPAKKIYLR